MAYALENALFQWQEGERRVHAAPDLERADLEDAVEAVIEELRRRLGMVRQGERAYVIKGLPR